MSPKWLLEMSKEGDHLNMHLLGRIVSQYLNSWKSWLDYSV